MQKLFCILSAGLVLVIGIIGIFWSPILFSFILVAPLILIGIGDMLQTQQTIRRNFPLAGRLRYLLELIRPEIYQYFIESNSDGVPFNREERSIVYQRAKGQLDTLPFGTQSNVYTVGYEWINHSLAPKSPLKEEPRIQVGGPDCKQPYSASVFNISAMSYGSLSKNAILALNTGAKLGGFAHNTGEGGLSPYHLQPGGDLIWQIGTGYFGCRNHDGTFNLDKFKTRANLPNVKMIEIKLSQGAKPGHGGILPARKVTQEIADIRDVPMGVDVNSPPAHSTFTSPLGLLKFIETLRIASNGKPVGFKICLGKHREFLAIAKAMLHSHIFPDFITVDGAEGGTGAAPLEFSNSVGTPLQEGLTFIHSTLLGIGARDQIKIIAAGKITTGFGIAQKLALGADMCNSARGMMFALGCIQALRCNTNHCPTGVATQDAELTKGLHVPDKATRVANFHKGTVHSFLEVIAAAGLSHPNELRPWHIQKRISSKEVLHYDEIHSFLNHGDLLKHPLPEKYERPWNNASIDTFN